MKPWQVSILTLFPQMFPGPLAYSIAGKAMDSNLFTLDIFDIRNYSQDKNKRVDDKIFGGGAGMLMRADVVSNALNAAIQGKEKSKLIYFSPRGTIFNQNIARSLIKEDNLLMLCGRYEGIDQRIFEKYDFTEISLGDYILSGGELAALTILDACIRLIPGVINNKEANKEESFSEGEYSNLLEYDQYTRPAEWEGRKVPEVLLSGNHKEISNWRRNNAIKNTNLRRS